MVETWTTEPLAVAARQALAKIEAALPERLKAEIGKSRMYAVDHRTTPELRARLDSIRQAVTATRIIEFGYLTERGTASRRTVHPLGLYFLGNVWTLVAWCLLRNDFRHFRADRMTAIEPGDPFVSQPGRTLDDFLARIQAEVQRPEK